MKYYEKIRSVFNLSAFMFFCPTLRNAVSFTVMNYEEVADYSQIDKDVRIPAIRDNTDFNAELDTQRQQKIDSRRK